MVTKFNQSSSVEPHRAQSTVMATSSVASVSTPKVSMFIKKPGFVIPKNKLAGSLVPAIRPRKTEGRDAPKEEDNKPIKRKTKWGTDLTEDAAVRKGRALAYQTRADQIAQQLKSGVLEKGDDEGTELLKDAPHPESSRAERDDQMQKLEMLALEKQEIIGEILKLNPSYKVPPDYKPLLKEAKIPIPVTRYPGYNFIGVILGPGSHTQKRLEEETGATIRIHGTKVATGEKGEITSLNGDVVQNAYGELYVHVSADTFEKIDAAVSLIELLISPVSGNPALATTNIATGTGDSGDSVNVFDQNQMDTLTPAGYALPMAGVNQGFMQPMVGPSHSGPTQAQFQPYRGPWFPPGPPQTAVHPHSGYVLSSHMANNTVQYPPTSINASTMHLSFSGHSQPPFIPGQQPPMQSLQRSYMPEQWQQSQSFPMLNNPMQSSPAFRAMVPQPNSTMPHQNIGPQHTAMRPLVSRPPTPSGSSVGWPGVLPAVPTSQGITNMMQINRPMGPPSEGLSPYPPPSNIPSFTSASTLSSVNEPTLGSTQSHVPPPLSLPQVQQGSILPPVTTPRPQRPNSGDFTFRPLVPPPQASPGLSNPFIAPQMLPRPTTLQLPLSPQLPSYLPAMNNSTLQVSIQSNQSPRAANQVGQSQAPFSFVANTPQIPQPQLRFPEFPNPNPTMMTSQIPHQGLRMPSSPGYFPPRTVNHLQLQQNQFGATIPSGSLFVQTQQFSSNNMQGFSPGVQNQGYDPFSPAAIPSSAPLHQREDSTRKQGS